MLARVSPGRVEEHAAGGSGCPPGRFIERQEELAVLEFLGPDAVVDAAAQVLDELAIDIGRDGRARPARIQRQNGVNCTGGE